MIAIGDILPDVAFRVRDQIKMPDGSAKVEWCTKSTADYFSGRKSVLFSLPGAFTPTCSTRQVPEYDAAYEHFRSLGFDDVYCISVNDDFVMKSWAKSLTVQHVNTNGRDR